MKGIQFAHLPRWKPIPGSRRRGGGSTSAWWRWWRSPMKLRQQRASLLQASRVWAPNWRSSFGFSNGDFLTRLRFRFLLSGVESGSVSTASGFSTWVRCCRELATELRRCRWHGGLATGAAATFELLSLLGRLPVQWLGHGGPQLGCALGREPAPGWASEEVSAHGW
jgi:hypothetical protein